MTPGGRDGAAGRGIDARRAVALVALCALTVACPPLLAAQAAPPIRQAFPMPEEYRGIQLRAQETQRTLLLAMVDSMPEALFRRAAADGQRDFAEQVHHAANANQYIVAHYQLGWD